MEVNENNKHLYVKKFCTALMIDSIQEQTKAFVKGFEQMIPRKVLMMFDERELGVKLTGISIIDGYY